MLERLDTYDWKEAFSYANFKIDEVEQVIADAEGENDGASWISYGKLKDGRYYFLSAGCDYTGWDCQAGGNSWENPNAHELIRWTMSDDDRDRLGLALPYEPHKPNIKDIED